MSSVIFVQGFRALSPLHVCSDIHLCKETVRPGLTRRQRQNPNVKRSAGLKDALGNDVGRDHWLVITRKYLPPRPPIICCAEPLFDDQATSSGVHQLLFSSHLLTPVSKNDEP